MKFSFTFQTTFYFTQKYTFDIFGMRICSDRMNEFDIVRNMKLQYGRLCEKFMCRFLLFFFFFFYFTQTHRYLYLGARTYSLTLSQQNTRATDEKREREREKNIDQRTSFSAF